MTQKTTPRISTESAEVRYRAANRITLIGSMVNLFLSGLKLFAGIIGHSQAMIADAIHSLSDLGTDIAVLVGLYLSAQPRDKGHNYGHGKYETFATLIIAVSLLSVGLGVGYAGIVRIFQVAHGAPIASPGVIALIGAVVSIAVKEALFRYTLNAGKKLNSTSLIANAYHHRSDAYSSLGVGIGIGATLLLGNNWAILDQIAAVVVSVLILKEAVLIGFHSINDLLEASIPEDDRRKIIEIAQKTRGVVDPHNLKTRRIGNVVALDLHIRVDATISVEAAHLIAHAVEDGIGLEFGADVLCSIHVEPANCIIDHH